MITRRLRGFLLLATCAAFAAMALAQPPAPTRTPAPTPVKPRAAVKPKPRAATASKTTKPKSKAKVVVQKPAPKPAVVKPVIVVAPPIVVVDGKPITKADMERYGYTDYGRKILSDMIDDQLIRRAAAKAGVQVAPEEVKVRVQELGGQQAAIARRGVAGPGALRRQIETELLLGKLADAESVVTDKQAQDYYAAHKRDYQSPGRDHLYQIVTDKAETAYNARKRISDGESFPKIAQEVSMDPSASKGGDMGWVSLDELQSADLRNVIATLRIGEVSTPQLVEGKFYILMVAEKEMPKTMTFDEAKPEVVEKIRAERGATPDALLARLRRQAKVQVSAPEYRYMEGELAQAREIKIVANGAPVEMKRPAIMEAGHMLVPGKDLFTAVGCQVQWVPSSKTMVIRFAKRTVRVTVGSDVAFAEGQAVAMGVKAQIRGGTVYVPPRPIAEALGLKVKWNPGDYTLEIRSK